MGQIVSDVTDILNYKENKNAAEKNKKKILSDIESDEIEKQNIVNKVLGAQRAKFGASGMSNDGATEKNVLDRLQKEIETSYENKKQANMMKIGDIKTKKKNILTSILEHLNKLI
ncbi:MAG: hypothetical protein J6Y07_01645 [Alphaproteobacteria bacterium]|nr:hypothetical protein [Alphaproteobacteria bacterium]